MVIQYNYQNLKGAVKMSVKAIYEHIARKNGVSAEEVERDIRIALQTAWKNPPDDGVTRAYQRRISPDGKPPSLEKVIQYALDELNTENKK